MDTYGVKKRKMEMKQQVISFVLMIVFTIIAFMFVSISSSPAIPLILMLLAIVQVVFQLYYFMHLKDEGTGFPKLFLYSGALVGTLTVAAFMLLIWW